jgi:hypothetical protein
MSGNAVLLITVTAVFISLVTVVAMQRAAGSSRQRGNTVPRLPRKIPRPIGASGSHMLVMGLTYAIYSWSLAFQSQRWHRTPAYHNLLIIMPTGTWGVFFGVSAVLLLAGAFRPRPPWLAYSAVLLAVMLTASWDVAFIVRWITNSATTPETWTSWAIFSYVLLRAGVLVGKERNRPASLPRADADG